MPSNITDCQHNEYIQQQIYVVFLTFSVAVNAQARNIMSTYLNMHLRYWQASYHSRNSSNKSMHPHGVH